jgi:hypothetical protein
MAKSFCTAFWLTPVIFSRRGTCSMVLLQHVQETRICILNIEIAKRFVVSRTLLVSRSRSHSHWMAGPTVGTESRPR